MRHSLKPLGVAFALAITPAFATAQVLWQNVSVGMSPKQVQAGQPTSVPQPKPENLASGAEALLEIPSFAIANDTYRVRFFFRDQKLVQVMLSAKDPSKAGFDGIVDLLRTRYGKELSLRPSSLGYDAKWKAPGGVNVSVVYYDRPLQMMNINYQVNAAAEAAKL